MGLAFKTWGATFLKLGDVLTTVYGIEKFELQELNPLMNYAFNSIGLYPSLALGMIAYHVAILFLVSKYHKKMARILYRTAVILSVVVVIYNLVGLVAITLLM